MIWETFDYQSQSGWLDRIRNYQSQSTSMGNISTQTNSWIRILDRFMAQDLKIDLFIKQELCAALKYFSI